jgi:outer membrane protein
MRLFHSVHRHLFALIVGTLFVGFTHSATAQAAEIKIGYVDLQRALNEVEEGAAAKAKLKKEFDTKQAQLDAKQAELTALKASLDNQGMMMKAEVKQEKMAELQKKLVETQQLYMAMQQELSTKEAQVTQGIFAKMGTILTSMGKEGGFTLIIEKSEGSVLYAKAHMDLTNELIRRYNDAYGLKKKKKK